MKHVLNSTGSSIVDNLTDFLTRVSIPYLCETFDLLPQDVDCTSEIGYIVICEDGDTHTGRIGSFVKQWWEVSDGQVRRVQRPIFTVSETGDEFDKIPIIKIFTEGERFVLGERYGTGLVTRRCRQLVDLLQGKSISSFPILWKSTP
ncbi:hypothetical protein DTL42_18565 [Bremerella cremea]|uniref:Uncharacterized protein n=1 Tax=Bremerella cremea TaxID=1031537 RepID=A0A368KMQ5_9BACT|nr:hypothetical protein DTL42_18565 [Bremerella cremea]